ncbi:MAG: hypothetical protein K0B15_16260 [Lentimicrobium sp.]|nr:hypothetical protein [Lentimicrobium sp.]
MKKINLILVFIAFAMLTFTSSCEKDKKVTPPNYDLTKLNAVNVSIAPVVDGQIDVLWASIPELNVALGETNNPPNDPSKIGNCAGCHAYNSSVSVKVKAVYSADNIYFLAEWPDPTASFTRGNSWNWDGTAWSRTEHTAQSEDRISFFWPIGAITGAPYSTGGCMTKCHMYYPTDTDPHVSTHGIVDDAWLTSGRADMWHSKAARGTSYTSAIGSGLTINPTTYEVTAGTFTQIGYADDKYVDVWLDDTQNGEDGGRYGDAGTGAYTHNRIGDKSRPKWIEKNPVDYADAMTLLDSEIAAGECAGDATTGVSDADAALYWPAYVTLTAVVPERILNAPSGSRADLAFGAVWNNGKWTAEFGRKLNTGNDDDIQFTDFAKEYLFNIAVFDNSRHGYEHRTSKNYYMKFY